LKSTEVMKNLFLSFFLKTLFLYSNKQDLLSNFSSFELYINTPSTFSIKDFTSTPYAPIFCIGAAPTDPGISDKFSIP